MLGLVPHLQGNVNKISAKLQLKLSFLRRNSIMKIWIWVLLGVGRNKKLKKPTFFAAIAICFN